jgi:predicted dehydrogenase
MAEVRVAVIGCGGMGGIHLSRWAEISGASIAAVCDRDPVTALRAATEFSAEAHTDWRDLLEGGGIHAVDICTPPDSHSAIASAALQNGLHVLCAMPLSRTLDEARALRTAAEENALLLMPGFCHRFHPPILFAQDMIENDDLGRIVMFRCRFSSLFAGVEDRWISDPTVTGGGVLRDNGLHAIDLFRCLVGEVKAARGRVSAFHPTLQSRGVEDSVAAVLEAENGALGVVECSWATVGGRNVVELYGTAGACFVDYDLGTVRFRTADMAVWETREIGGADRFHREISHFADAVRRLQEPVMTIHDALRAQEIATEIYQDAR